MGFLENTIKMLNKVSIQTNEVLIAFSGGKDSVCVLDLAKKHFKDVKCFTMELVPDLNLFSEVYKFYENKYDVEILRVPHWGFFQFKRDSLYSWDDLQRLPKITLSDIYGYVRSLTGYEHILTGYKKCDSLWRRQAITTMNKGQYANVHPPVWDWNKYEVLAYIKERNLPLIGITQKTNATEIDLSRTSLYDLYDYHKDDFEMVERYFPFIGAVIKWRELYGGKDGFGNS
jgi:3'-phosphoadenosine 5'-phosphosulfate sulfotransferase (PAPS reductase)/FAD synthetase